MEGVILHLTYRPISLNCVSWGYHMHWASLKCKFFLNTFKHATEKIMEWKLLPKSLKVANLLYGY